MARQRLQKIIAQAGLASRRAAEELIEAGRVRVNGRIVRTLGSSADGSRDQIEVDGKRLVAEQLVYLVLHKPRNVVSTLHDPQGRPTVAELVARVQARLFPVGRLDFATSGVLLLTNDGGFADGLLRPRHGVPKTYVVKIAGRMTDEQLQQWRDGVELDDGRRTRPAEVKLLRYEEGDKTWLELTLREGRNQQIRRMAEAIGLRVMRLARMSFAGIECQDLRPGRYRALTVAEQRELRKSYGVPKRVRSPAAPSAGNGSRQGQRATRQRGGSSAATQSRQTPRAKTPRSKTTAERSARSGTKPRAAGRRGARGRGRAPR